MKVFLDTIRVVNSVAWNKHIKVFRSEVSKGDKANYFVVGVSGQNRNLVWIFYGESVFDIWLTIKQ